MIDRPGTISNMMPAQPGAYAAVYERDEGMYETVPVMGFASYIDKIGFSAVRAVISNGVGGRIYLAGLIHKNSPMEDKGAEDFIGVFPTDELEEQIDLLRCPPIAYEYALGLSMADLKKEAAEQGHDPEFISRQVGPRGKKHLFLAMYECGSIAVPTGWTQRPKLNPVDLTIAQLPTVTRKHS